MLIDDVLSSHFGVKVDLTYLQMFDADLQHVKDAIYTEDGLKKLIRKVQDAIDSVKRSPTHVYNYASTVIDGRWPEAEETLKKDPFYCLLYSYHVIKGRWPEAEEIIRRKAHTAYLYAHHVIDGRWPEAEEIIKADPSKAYAYAKNVIKGRWPEAGILDLF